VELRRAEDVGAGVTGVKYLEGSVLDGDCDEGGAAGPARSRAVFVELRVDGGGAGAEAGGERPIAFPGGGGKRVDEALARLGAAGEAADPIGDGEDIGSLPGPVEREHAVLVGWAHSTRHSERGEANVHADGRWRRDEGDSEGWVIPGL